MVNLEKLSNEDLVAKQQDLMVKRGEAESRFKTEQQSIQFELDKRAAKERFGTLTEADRVAYAELVAQAEASEENADG